MNNRKSKYKQHKFVHFKIDDKWVSRGINQLAAGKARTIPYWYYIYFHRNFLEKKNTNDDYCFFAFVFIPSLLNKDFNSNHLTECDARSEKRNMQIFSFLFVIFFVVSLLMLLLCFSPFSFFLFLFRFRDHLSCYSLVCH